MTAHPHFSRRKLTQPSPGRPAWWLLSATIRFVRGLLALVVLLALVAGLPWALVRFVGWPLPNHVPTWDEIQAVLLNPMSSEFLLDTLAVLCWIVWFFFALDVARCTVDAARGITWPQVRPPGPLHGLAAALIGTIVLTLLGSRTSSTVPTTAIATLAGDLAPVAVVAPLTPGPTTATTVHLATAVQPTTTMVIDRTAPAPPGTVQVTEEVRLPHDGIYDSLWRVAERVYGPGGGSRWPELFQLNRGVEQPDGRALTNPNLVRPGWKITAYIPAPPDDHPPGEQQQVPPQQPPPPTSTAPSTPTPSTQPVPATTQTPAATRDAGDHSSNNQSGSGLDLLTGAFVGLGLAGAITTAMVSARMWRRRRYRIGSGDRADLQRPIAPVVRALRAAHDDGGQQVNDDVEFVDLAPAPPRIHITAAGALEPDDEPVPVPTRVGVRGGRELALNLASTRGLGLAGPGATAAARALLLHLLTEQQPGDGICVLVPADDLHLVFDGVAVQELPSTVRVVATLDAALDEMEAALLTRTRHAIEETDAQTAPASLVLLASPQPHAERRLQAVLDNGSTLGLAGVLLGQWRPGATVLVRHDGTVSATSPGLGDALTGTRLFNLPATDATDLLTVLRDAEGPVDLVAADHVDLSGEQQVPFTEDHEDGDAAVAPVPEQRSVEEMTQLESTRPPKPEERPQVAPIPSLQLLDVQPIPMDVQPDQPVSAATPNRTDEPATTGETKCRSGQTTQRDQPPSPTTGDQPTARRHLVVRLLGRLQLTLEDDAGERELNGVLTPKQRELLVYLSLHPQGVRREVLNEAVWPDSRPPRPYNSFHNTLSMLRRALTDATDGLISNLILNDDGRYQLNADLVVVDFWQLQRALQAPRRAGADVRAQLHEAIELYHGDLAEDLLVPWIEPFREATRRDVLDALGTLIRAHGDTDPETMLTLLERTRKLDRYNEGVYRDIVRTQARLGQYAAIPRTLALLKTTLDEIDQHPSADTLNLADFLQRRGGTRRTVSSDAAAS
ncbi:BTAD domain-containing putative transcriptional regulator [Amycolatopsis rubida]|uniref:Transcriptional activator domain-containing protein n=1 Tax=Amycolatopsis rubida TaxID=112413 RepID=A0A1I5WI73_9PSEU|nr:BTAD domain-containing putative transcriptional regulator [Amycolatopsis rubida]SFQ19523.1 transcriptional activator domain-containing protein [Amycolatopsis rubida]